MNFKISIIVLILTIYSVNTFAHPDHMTTVRGCVTNERTKEPLSFINITFIGLDESDLTDENGNYIIKNIHSGDYIMQITAVGYETYKKHVTLKPNTVNTINIELIPTDLNLSEVSVIGKAARIDRQNSSIITSNINTKTFESTQSTTLSQGLNYSPGVRVETTCQNCGSQEVRINGLEGNYSQILIDGQPVVGALTKTYGLDQMPINMIDQIDIVRGGSSALYASSAIGGVINILTKDPEKNYYEVKYNLAMIDGKSSDNILTLNTSLVSDDKKSGISIFGNMRNRNPWDANGDGFSEIGKNKTGSFGFRSFVKPNKNNKLALEYHYITEERRGGDSFDKPPHETAITEYTNYHIHSGSATYNQFFKDKMHKLIIHAAIQDARRDSYFGANYEANGYGTTSEITLIGNANYEINTNNFIFMPSKFIVGYTQSHDNLKSNMPGYNYHQNQLINISTLYVQNEWKDDKLALSVGLRGEKHTLVKNYNIIPRANIRYQILSNINLRGTYTEGYRTAELTGADLDIGIQDGKATLLEIANNIKPERSRGFSGGIDYSYYHNKFYSYFLVEGFRTQIRNAFIDRIIGENEMGNTILSRENANRATVYGVNLETSIQTGEWLQINGGYTIQQGKYKSPESWSDDEDVAPTRRLLRSPNQYGFLAATLTPKSKFSGSVASTYTGTMYVPHLAGYIDDDVLKKTRKFFDMTIKINYTLTFNTLGKIEISSGIQNLFNQMQKDYDRGINRDSDYIYGPALPRTYFIGIKVSSL